jgi:hypothetical protein
MGRLSRCAILMPSRARLPQAKGEPTRYYLHRWHRWIARQAKCCRMGKRHHHHVRRFRCNPLLISPMAGLFRARMSHGLSANLAPACKTPSCQPCPTMTTREFRRTVIGCATLTRQRALPEMTLERGPFACRLPIQPRTLSRTPSEERLRSPSLLALGSPVIRQFRSIEARRLRILVLVQRLQEIKMLPAMTS